MSADQWKQGLRYYIGYCNFLVLNCTWIFMFYTPFALSIRIWVSYDYSARQILYVEEMVFFQVIFNLISTVPSLSTVATR